MASLLPNWQVVIRGSVNGQSVQEQWPVVNEKVDETAQKFEEKLQNTTAEDETGAQP